MNEENIWRSYVAIGDSFTEGMSDPSATNPDEYVGWADRLASQLARRNAAEAEGFAYANLAVRGRLLDDIVGPQLEAALTMQPDLVSIVGGGNDIMRPSVNLDDVADRLDEAVGRIRASGADVLMATLANPVGSAVLGRLRSRFAWHVANIWAIAQRHNAYVLDLWELRALRDPRMWGIDRLHLSTEGHKRVATQAAWALGLPTDEGWRTPLPPSEPLSRSARARANLTWAREYAGPWVERRLKGTSSGDGRAPKRPSLQPIDLLPKEDS